MYFFLPSSIRRIKSNNDKDFKKFKVITGLSDHTLDYFSNNSYIIRSKDNRKHFIIDKTIDSPDSSFSLNKGEFKEMVDAIRKTEKALGEVNYKLTKTQKKGKNFSRSLYVCKDVKKGEIVSENNIRSVRPGFGLHPKFYYKVLGKKFTKNLYYGDRLLIENIK